ncbi:hypothetical protein COLO4_07805 [Corchorus olitorius]|uniref:Uncharacterized protein n=1 Tax=Corchorus olitorius TaxID=93759 RepID=A0A1R3KIK0_9ROSI|nr:hypothetical protein COLO4_07805 [Corchorus olitorius]
MADLHISRSSIRVKPEFVAKMEINVEIQSSA